MFLRHPNFFDQEKLAPILDRNNDFLVPEDIEKYISRTQHWHTMATKQIGFNGTIKLQELPPTPSDRIIKHDAERTFTSENRRKILAKVLSNFENHFKDYHQGLALTCGFLLLTLTEQQVLDIVYALATHPQFIPEYWRAEAIAGAKDAYVWEYLLQRHHPEIAQHLKKNNVLPETFCQKWFIALTINVLPFKALYNFFDFFLEQGHLYLFKFGLVFTSTFKDEILKSPDYEIFKILRYDKELHKKMEINDDMMCDVVQRASTLKLVEFDINSVRNTVFKEKLEARLERARKLAQEQKEEDLSEDFSSTESGSGSGSGSESESGAECSLCKENAPDMWCATCKVILCEMCHNQSKKGHKKTHKVDENWEKHFKK